MRVFSLLAFLTLFGRVALAQCLSADASAFNLDTEVCVSENFRGEATSAAGSYTYEWDFCSGDLSNTPTSKSILTNAAFGRARSLRFIQDGANWYAFAISATLNTLMRLDFGTDPYSTPTYTTLGNVGSVLSTAFSFDVVKHNDVWYIFVANGGNKNIVRYTFTNGLQSTPQVSLIENTSVFSAAGPNYISIVQDTDGYYAFVSVGTTITNSKVVVLKFQTPDGTPAFSEFTVTGANTPRGISLVKECGQWYGFLISFNTNTLHRLSFGTSLLNTPSASILNTSGLLNQPVSIKVVNEKAKYYALIQNARTDEANAAFYRLGFGTSIANTLLDASKLQFSTLTGGGYALDVVSVNSKWSAFTFNLTTQSLVSIDFPNNCSASAPLSYGSKTDLLNYQSSGTYNVTLKTTDLSGNISMTSKSITVTGSTAPSIDIATENVCALHDVNFGISSAGGNIPTSQLWFFGDGTQSSDGAPTHQYQIAGDYDVELWVSDAAAGCENRDTRRITIYDVPKAAFTAPENTICTNTQITFANPNDSDLGGLLESKWYLNDALIGTSFDLTHTFLETTSGVLRLNVGIPGCTTEASLELTNIQSGPVGSFTTTPTCENEFITLDNTSQGDFAGSEWWIDDVLYTEASPHIMLPAGSHDVQLNVKGNNGCVTIINKNLEIYPIPVAEFGLVGSGLYCQDAPLQFVDFSESDIAIADWHWDFVEGTSSEPNPIVYFSSFGSHPVTLEITDEHGCKDDVTYSINVLKKPQPSFAHGNLCISSPITFAASGTSVSKWSWQIDDKKYSTWNPVHTFRNAGNFPVTLTATGSNGCETVIQETVHIYPAVVPTFTVNNNCPDMPAMLTDVSGSEDEIVSWLWNVDGDEFSTSSVTYTFPQPGLYPVELMIKTASGCNYTSVEDVEVVEAPVAAFRVSSEIGAPDVPFVFTNTSSDATIFTWDFGDGNGSDINSPEHHYASLGNYLVKLTAANEQGCAATASKTLQIKAPAPDARIISIETSKGENNTIQLNLIIQNGGNTVFENLRINIDISGTLILTETIPDRIVPGSRYNLSLNYGILENKSLQFICADAVLAEDINAIDNKNCVNVNAEAPKLLPVYPNPAIGEVGVEWMGGNASEATITIVNSLGIQIFRRTVQNEEGLNTLAVDLSRAEGGIYMVVMECGSTLTTHRFVLAH